MIKTSCPHCGVRLSAPDELVGKPVNCQKCSSKFVLYKRWMNEPFARSGDSSGTNLSGPQFPAGNTFGNSALNSTGDSLERESGTPAGSFSAEPEKDDSKTVSSDLTAATASSLPDQLSLGLPTELSQPSEESNFQSSNPLASVKVYRSSASIYRYDETVSILTLFDFRFRYFLTPSIIRVTWFLVMILMVVGVLMLSYFYLSSLMAGRSGLFQFEGGEGQVGDLENSEVTMLAGKVPPPLLNTALFFSILLGGLIGVLWIRVLLETIMMIFSVGGSLRETKNNHRLRR